MSDGPAGPAGQGSSGQDGRGDAGGHEGHGGGAPQDGPSPLAQAWDIARYAPVGILMEGPYLLPKLAEMGKVHVRNARVVGEMAVRQGREQLRSRLEGLELDEQASALLRLVGVLPEADQPEADPAATGGTGVPDGEARDDGGGEAPADSAADPGDLGGDGGVAPATPPATPPAAAPAGVGEGTGPVAAPPVGALAIPDYESLSAPQVVSRLPDLSAEELEAVRAFETAYRGRRTILGRIAQLEG